MPTIPKMDKMAWGNPVEKMFLVKRNVNLRIPTVDLRMSPFVEILNALNGNR